MSRSHKFDKLTFSLYANAHEMSMYESYYKNGQWDDGQIVPFHNIELSPSANVLNYGQGIFEGMKAYRSVKNPDKIVMFRPEENARRFGRSCEKMAIPVVNEQKFMDAVQDLILDNLEFIPETDDGSHSLYLRPVCIGIEALLGVRASREYLFYIFGSPVGPYFSGVGVVRLIVTDTHRASAHGTGDAKAVCNYAGTMRPRNEAIAAGYDGVLFLDSVENTYIEEAGAANVFVLMDNDTLVTPQLGSILPGITRESIVRVASELFGMKVEERNIPIDEVCNRGKECFLCGTGAIITSVSEISWNGQVYNLNQNDFQLAKRMYDQLIGIQLQRNEDPFGWVTELN